MELSPRLVEQLIFGAETQRRRTQDSPVLPDVWAYFATPSAEPRRLDLLGPKAAAAQADPDGPLDLLLTPHRSAGPPQLATEVRNRLERSRKRRGKGREPARIAYTQSYVVARLCFDEVVTVLVPLTQWWRKYVWRGVFEDADADSFDDRTLSDVLKTLDTDDLVTALDQWTRMQAPDLYPMGSLRAAELSAEGEAGERALFADDLLWMLRIIGTIQWARELTPAKAKRQKLALDELGRVESLPKAKPPRKGRAKSTGGPAGGEVDPPIDYRPLVDAGLGLLKSSLPVLESRSPSLWLINRNRKATRAVKESRRAVKADAASNLFDISCEDLTWAVVDSGIDASHPAFLRKEPADAPWARRTRVEKTYDFTRLRPLLDQEVVREILNAPDILQHSFADPPFEDPQLEAKVAPIRVVIYREDAVDDARKQGGAARFDPSRRRLRTQLEELSNRLQTGREIDWELLDPLLEVAHDDAYERPLNHHGTHVAGILAADWEEKELRGICPDLNLWDFRVLDPHGPNDEFTVLAALQFIQYVNKQNEALSIQGANLSLSIRHEVTNYACGRTPVCEECERLLASGVVVVAAGGNAGWDDDLARVAPGAGYRVVSITDPGNAAGVITVGATHRDRPHSYGVSFFSSRGPTGDGRAKPDLVAPGEKITSTVPGGEGLRREDGTSMAAPHVSGAAALLMARHRELVGQPQRIKEILCRTATDLGRTRDFQGAGMLDVLRALQSV